MSTLPQAVGDWTLRGLRARGYDLMFAPEELSDSALSAASRAQQSFHLPFPAWNAYRAIINGHASYFPALVDYATGVGLAMILAKRPDGRALVRDPGAWMVQAAQDAMARAIVGSFPKPATQRAEEYGIPRRTYSRIRDTIAAEFIAAIEDFQAVIHREAERVLRFDRKLP